MSFKKRISGRSAATLFGLIGLSVVSTAAHAQGNYTFGGDARAFSMGGAGLAILQDRSGTRPNPASLTFESRPFGLNLPSIGVRSNHFDASSATNFITKGTKGDDATNVAIDFARKNVDDDADFGINGNASLRIGKLEISGFAVGRGRLQPNDTLKAWSKNSGQLNDLTKPQYDQSRLDLIGAGYYTLPAVAFASTLPVAKSNPYNIGVGVRIKAMTSYYTHYIADAYALANQPSIEGGQVSKAFLAPEMNGKDYLKQTGVGADFGVLARPRSNQGVSYALVAANLINPGFKFDGTDRNGDPKRYDILKTTLSTGVAYQKKATTVALDWADMTGATGSAQLRAGAEQRIGNIFALRAGYNSSTGGTYGIGLFGFDVAFGKKVPLEVIKTLNF